MNVIRRNKLRICILLGLLTLLAVGAGQAIAATGGQILVTLRTTAADAPTDFAAYRVSDDEVGVIWTPHPSAANTMVRRKYGEPPADRTDGELVYYGAGDHATDTPLPTGINESTEVIYYRAWSQDAVGLWADPFAESAIREVGVVMIALAVLPLGLTCLLGMSRNMLFGYPALMFWAVFAGYMYGESTATWDWQYLTFFASIGMVIFCALAMYALRRRDLDARETDWLDHEQFADEGKQVKKTEKVDTKIYSMWGDSDDYTEGREEKEIGLRERAEKRSSSRRRKKDWGEFGPLY